MLYKIGTLAQILGLPLHVIRFYERKGLLTSKHVKGSTTRYFDEYDINRLIFAKLYRKLNFSLEEIQELFEREKRFEVIDYYRLCTKKQKEVQDEIQRLQKIQRQLRQYKDHFYEFSAYQNKVTTIHLPKLYWSFTMDQVRSVDAAPTFQSVTEVISRQVFPEIHLMALGDLREADEKKEQYRYDWGLAFEEKYLPLFSGEQKKLLKVIPEKDYYMTYTVPDRSCILKKEMTLPLIRHAKTCGTRPSGYILADLLPGGLLALYLPVK